MKKSKIIIIGIIMIAISGCESRKNEVLNCDILDDIKYTYLDDYVVTSKGELYKFGKFSDEKDCKKIESDQNIVGIFDYFLKTDKKELYKVNDFNLEKYPYIENFKPFAEHDDILKIMNAYVDGKYIYYYLKDDGIIYSGNLKSEIISGHMSDPVIENEKVFIKFEGEKILDFSLEINDFIVWIKTDKSYYVNRVKDEKCYTYDDIKCEYEFKKDNDLTKKYNEISYIRSCNNQTKCDYLLKNGELISDGG